MSSGVPGWLEPLLAIGAVVLPLLVAWWLVGRDARPRRKRRARDNAPQRRDLS
jgi:hypothetical protein